MPFNYWVAERWDDGDLTARWTTERPGKTGPRDLADRLAQLREDGWRVYEVSVSASPDEVRREALRDLVVLLAPVQGVLLLAAAWMTAAFADGWPQRSLPIPLALVGLLSLLSAHAAWRSR